MSRRALAGWSAVVTCVTAAGVAWTFASAQARRAPEELLPAGAVLYASWDGSDEHQEAWEATAAHEALVDSGLADVGMKLVTSVTQQMRGAGVPVEVDGVFGALEKLMKRGTSFAVTVDPAAGPIPTATLLLHDSADLEPLVGGAVRSYAEGEGIEPAEKTIDGRKVVVLQPPGTPMPIDIGWWTEGGHLVIVAGPEAVAKGVAVAKGDAPNITTDPLWKRYGGKADFEVASRVWVDFARVRAIVGPMPMPPLPDGRVVTIKDVLEPLGLNGLDTFVVRSGYDGRAMRSDVRIDAPGPRKGLLRLLDQKPMSLADLPPLPADATTFSAASFDAAMLYEVGVEVSRGFVKFGPPSAAEDLDDVLEKLPRQLGFDPKADLLDPLGNVWCGYSEGNAGLFGLPFGLGLAVSVNDADKLATTLNGLVARGERMASPDQLSVRRTRYSGEELVTLEVGGGFVNPTFVVEDDWMVIGVTPQTVQSFLLRRDGKLAKWSPESHKDVLATVPETFTSISLADPRPAVGSLMGMAPTLLGFAQGGLRQSGGFGPGFQLPISAADLPPAELVTRPLFPNVSVGTTDDDGYAVVTRSSLPAMPSLGGGAATTPVLVALLLPAVQQAREAARNAQSKNNLKQIAIAMHNYHDVYSHLPVGTVENTDLKPDKRLSWMYSILPMVEQSRLYEGIDGKKAWSDDANERFTSLSIQVYENPGAIVEKPDSGLTHYVGIAGYGKDPWLLPNNSPRAGVFGYDRKVRFRDVLDGTSNTMAVSEASGDYGHWAAGGSATIRGFTQKPYLNGPDGIGGPYRNGTNAMMLDGSVRSISPDIDPKVLEALSTKAGGEVVRGF